MVDHVPLGTLVRSVSVRGYQVTTDKYGDVGDFPIVDQGQSLICGYTSEQRPLPCALPVTVFGDHTREVKFIDFPFVVGADGTKVLEPANGEHPRYLNALIEYAADRISNLGYSRHYKELKEAEVPFFTSPVEQRRIAAVLDAWDAAIATADKLVDANGKRFKAALERVSRTVPVMVPLETFAEIRPCIPNIGVQQAQDSGPPLLTAGGVTGRYQPAMHSGKAIVLSAIGSQCGKCFYVDGDWTAGANTIIIQPFHSAYTRFLYHFLNTRQPWSIQGSGQPYISPRNARRAGVPNVDRVTVSRFGDLLDCALEAAEQARLRLQSFRQQKHAIMQQLLAGRLRVPESIDALLPADSSLEAAA